MNTKILIELQYLPSIPYYLKILPFDEVYIEACENFVKSSYRNRCEIASPNGRQVLSIPLEGGKDKRQIYQERQICNDFNWQKNHWFSLCAAYRRSPYFEFYEDGFEPFFTQPWQSLWQFNWELFTHINNTIGFNKPIVLTEKYKKTPTELNDCRNLILPKNIAENRHKQNYLQVFQEKTGFIANLSVLDLLFNEGPNTLMKLKDMLR